MAVEDGFIPDYFRVEEYLRKRIQSGRLKAGDPVPPESQLAQDFGISRMTVRHALSRLVFEGVIERHRGRGSFVAEPRFQHTHLYPSFEQEMEARGAKTSHKLLARRLEPAEGKVAAALRLPAGTPVIVLERQRLVEGRVIGYEVRYFPRHIAEALTDEEIQHKALVPAMKRVLGRVHTRLRLSILAAAATSREARILGVPSGAPVLVRVNTWYVEPEGPIQYGKSVYRGDRYQMDLDLDSWPQRREDKRKRIAGDA